MSFAVIEVEQYYDGAENLVLKGLFKTEELANEYIQSEEKKRLDEWKVFEDYLDRYINNIQMPVLDKGQDNCRIWEKFTSDYPMFRPTPLDFKKELKSTLRNGYKPNKNDFHPPFVRRGCFPLLVLEIEGTPS